MDHSIFLAKGQAQISLLGNMANRHGLIAGATGTGKTVTLRVLAEGFSKLGVPVFMADVKGDLSGLAAPGVDNPKIAERVEQLGLGEFKFEKFPVVFWDVFGKKGHPLRASVSELGPLLLSRLLNLNDTQSGVLSLLFKVADDNGLLLLDLNDLRAMLQFIGENAKDLTLEYGNVSTASIGAISRNLLALAEQGGEKFFGEPSLSLEDLIQTDSNGHGVINILAADTLMQQPKVYSTLLLWLLSELFENLPEVGDLELPKIVFFFDEAHLLFDEAPKPLLEKIEQVVRLIRSKGVGAYFVTQSPLDVPDSVLGQLGNRVQHALRAFTPKDQKFIKAAAQTFRSNSAFDVESTLTELGVGEALISLLDAKGTPEPVNRALIAPPRSRLGVLTDPERSAVINSSVLYGHYEQVIDRDSAYEKLKAKKDLNNAGRQGDINHDQASTPKGPARTRQSPIEAMVVSAARSIGSQLGRQILRGVLGSILGNRR